MEFVKPGTYIDFMRWSRPVITVSGLLVLMSILSLVVWPKANLGTDFAGGTELQLEFRGRISSEEVRTTLTSLGYDRPDVVAVQGASNQFIIRISEISSIPPSRQATIKQAATTGFAEGGRVTEFEFSEGGDKIVVRFSAARSLAEIESGLEAAGADIRSVNQYGSPEEFRYEAQLVGIGEEIVSQLSERLGARGPEAPLRVEWVGPRAGEQLRDSAIKALLYTLAFIMVYVAFRFDLRFAPGAILSLAHDVILTLGIYVILQREVAISTVASLLTVLGFSINDTIVVYDRIRENMQRERGKSLREIINISTSQMLSRNIITQGLVISCIVPFIFLGTPALQDIALSLAIGVLVGTYSSVYIAAPVTEWLDRRFFRDSGLASAKPQAPAESIEAGV
jgi:preprotein translocase subunit SecF